jgi:hypothetical protein
MKTIVISILILNSVCCAMGQQVYLKKHSNGHLKKLRPKTILSFATSDSTSVRGRIVSATDSSFMIATYAAFTRSELVEIPLSSVREIRNDLMNDPRLLQFAGWSIIGGAMGVLMIPVAWIADGAGAALDGVKFVGVIAGAGLVLVSPYLIKRKFNTRSKWTLVVQ